MLKYSKTLNAYTEDKFLARAWANYLNECNEAYAEFINALTEASTIEVDSDTEVEAAVDDIITQHNWNPNLSITFGSGYSNLKDCLLFVAQKMEDYGDVSNNQSGDAITDRSLRLVNNDGSTSSQFISVSDIFDFCKSSFHSSTVMQAAFESMDGESIADRLEIFKDKVSSRFTNVFDDISSTFNTVSDMVGSGFKNVSTFIRTMTEYIGAQKQANDNQFTVDTSDIASYTGASPLPALNFSSAIKTIGTIGKVVGLAVWNILKAVGGLVWSLFSWIGKKIGEKIMPYDLSVIDKDAPGYTIDGWSYTETEGLSSTHGFNGTGEIELDRILFRTIIENQADHWIKLDFLGCEFMFKTSGATITGSDDDSISVDIEYRLKPKPINPEILKQAMSQSGDGDSYWDFTVTDSATYIMYEADPVNFLDSTAFDECLATKIEYMRANNFRPDLDIDSEEDVFRYFQCGLQFSQWLLENINNAIYFDDSGLFTTTYLYITVLGHNWNPTNKDWLRLISGWNGSTSPVSFGPQYITYVSAIVDSVPTWDYSNMETLIRDMFSIWAYQQYDKHVHPWEFIFLPYQNDVADFDKSKYAIKTDGENQAALTNFLTTAAIIVIGAAVTIGSAVLINKLRRFLLFRKMSYVGQADNIMWSGGRLTGAQAKKYCKYYKKVNACGLLTGGLQQTAASALGSTLSNADTSSLVSSNLSYETILEVIKG